MGGRLTIAVNRGSGSWRDRWHALELFGYMHSLKGSGVFFWKGTSRELKVVGRVEVQRGNLEESYSGWWKEWENIWNIGAPYPNDMNEKAEPGGVDLGNLAVLREPYETLRHDGKPIGPGFQALPFFPAPHGMVSSFHVAGFHGTTAPTFFAVLDLVIAFQWSKRRRSHR